MTQDPTPRDRPRITHTTTGSPHARILSVGSYRPERVVTNEEIIQRIDSSDEWIRDRSGIVTRRFAAPDESVTDMAEHATPSAASLLAHRLGSSPAAALDLSAACAGFCYGIPLAQDLVRGGTARHVLLIGAEKVSDYADLEDRGTAFLFGDGAGAVVIGPSQTPAIGPTVWGSDGAQWDVINQSASFPELRRQILAGEPDLSWPNLTMAGQTVFRWAVWAMAPIAQKALDSAGITGADLAAFIPHQANVRIVDALAKRLALPPHVAIARDIAHSGNTSAASVPLAMDHMLSNGEAPHGGLALLIGFGAGLVYAAQIVELP